MRRKTATTCAQQEFRLEDLDRTKYLRDRIKAFPPTRYQGSKRKLLPWLSDVFSSLQFDTVLDLFSGTASVSYLLKCLGKRVTANDKLRFNKIVASALVVNEKCRLDESETTKLMSPSLASYQSFIADNFSGLFYLEQEDRWLDMVVQNIEHQLVGFKKDLAFFALFQACLLKRPYNLFHRANVYLRTADVPRSFGNKTTWDRHFALHFETARRQANAAVLETKKQHKTTALDFRYVKPGYDLVYLDPPYLTNKGTPVDYLDFYHFLEGLTHYTNWTSKLSRQHKHKPLRDADDSWSSAERTLESLSLILEIHCQSIIVLSYRTCDKLKFARIQKIFAYHGRSTQVISRSYQYALSTRLKNEEFLLVSEPKA